LYPPDPEEEKEKVGGQMKLEGDGWGRRIEVGNGRMIEGKITRGRKVIKVPLASLCPSASSD